MSATRPWLGNRSRPRVVVGLVVVGLCVPVGGGPPGFRCCLLLVAPRVFRVPSGPAAREIATREPAARSRRSRSPANPSGPSGTLHTGGAYHCCAHPIQAPPPTGPAAKPHSQASLVPQLTRRPPHRRCLVCWWVIGIASKPGQVLPPPTGTAVGHQPGAVCPALVSNLARWGCSIRSWLAACRGSNDAISPRFEAVRLRFVVVRCSKCRPPR